MSALKLEQDRHSSLFHFVHGANSQRLPSVKAVIPAIPFAEIVFLEWCPIGGHFKGPRHDLVCFYNALVRQSGKIFQDHDAFGFLKPQRLNIWGIGFRAAAHPSNQNHEQYAGDQKCPFESHVLERHSYPAHRGLYNTIF